MNATQLGTLLAALAGVITAVTGLVKAVKAGRRAEAANKKADLHARATHDQVHPYPPEAAK